jgi:hypothetical protein
VTRIGCGAGFWGDRPDAPAQLIERSEIDYLALEYLAEVTMGILHRVETSGRPGYATDFVRFVVEDHLGTAMDQDITIVTNAGGLAPEDCADRVAEIATEQGLDPTIAIVSGDDLASRLNDISEIDLEHFDSGESFSTIADDVVAAAAYLGALPVAEALDQGADIVITGRIVDPALALGPLMHEHGWKSDDYDHLAAGIVAGHLIECGTQVTGGNLSKGWRNVKFADIGYPIADVDADGLIRLMKTPDTGGVVSKATVAEQLVYEIGDPEAYVTPDVIADFTSLAIESGDKNDAVIITGVKGAAPPDSYKVSIHHRAGHKLAGNLLYSRPDALEKARVAADILRERIDALDLNIEQTHAEFIGHDAAHGPMAPEQESYNEIMLRFAAWGNNQNDLRRLGMEFAPLSLSGPPSVAGLTDQGRPHPRPVIDVWPTLVPKTIVNPEVTIHG